MQMYMLSLFFPCFRYEFLRTFSLKLFAGSTFCEFFKRTCENYKIVKAVEINISICMSIFLHKKVMSQH